MLESFLICLLYMSEINTMKWLFYLHTLCVMCNRGVHGGLKRASDPVELKLEMAVRLLCGCWESIQGPLQELVL